LEVIHLSNSGAENTPKSGTARVKNNAPSNPEQLKKKTFPKDQKTTLLNPKMVKTLVTTLAKKVDFCVNYRDLSSNICFVWAKKINRSH